MDIMTFFTKCHATLLAMWISERCAEEWRANIGAPIGACHETIPCVGRNQEAPVEQIITNQKLIGISRISPHTVPQPIGVCRFSVIEGGLNSLIVSWLEVNFSFQFGDPQRWFLWTEMIIINSVIFFSLITNTHIQFTKILVESRVR